MTYSTTWSRGVYYSIKHWSELNKIKLLINWCKNHLVQNSTYVLCSRQTMLNRDPNWKEPPDVGLFHVCLLKHDIDIYTCNHTWLDTCNHTGVAWVGESHRSTRFLVWTWLDAAAATCPTGGALLGTWHAPLPVPEPEVVLASGSCMCGSVLRRFILCFRFFNIVACNKNFDIIIKL